MQVTQVIGAPMVCHRFGPAAHGTTAHDAKHHESANHGMHFMPGISCRFARRIGTPGACAIAPNERKSRGGARHQSPRGEEKQNIAQERRAVSTCGFMQLSGLLCLARFHSLLCPCLCPSLCRLAPAP